MPIGGIGVGFQPAVVMAAALAQALALRRKADERHEQHVGVLRRVGRRLQHAPGIGSSTSSSGGTCHWRNCIGASRRQTRAGRPVPASWKKLA
jgi:hypothetical protein